MLAFQLSKATLNLQTLPSCKPPHSSSGMPKYSSSLGDRFLGSTHNAARTSQALRAIRQHNCSVHLPGTPASPPRPLPTVARTKSMMQLMNIPLLLHTDHSPRQKTAYIYRDTGCRRNAANLEMQEPGSASEMVRNTQTTCLLLCCSSPAKGGGKWSL